jgi:hypothetical protein
MLERETKKAARDEGFESSSHKRETCSHYFIFVPSFTHVIKFYKFSLTHHPCRRH